MTHLVTGLRTSAGRTLGVEHRTPSLTWHVPDAREIGAVHVQLAADTDFEQLLHDSGPQPWAAIWYPWPAPPLTTRQCVHWRVRVRTEHGWTEWAASHVEAGLDDGDWVARPLALRDDPGATVPSPAPLMSARFQLATAPASARLYLSALGLVEATINGKLVSEDVLTPGWSAYQHRVAYETYDVTDLLHSGENELAGVLGDGWYRGSLVWGDRRHRCHYGDRTALIAQLEVALEDGTTLTVATDDTWTARTSEVRSADLYDGTHTDLTITPELLAVEVLGDLPTLFARQGPPIRRTTVLPAVATEGIYDTGQNIAGWLRITVRAEEGQTVTARHAEVLVDGKLATFALRSAKATDTWVLTEGEHVLEPRFTFHGFRYAEVVTEAEVLTVEAVAVHSDLVPTARFACSDPRLDRLHSNVVWGQRGNFLSVPTDCPQRDERLGWTGDAQVFAATAGLLHDCRGFFADWLADLRLEQHPDGQVPVVVPDVLTPEEAGIAGWGDAAVVVPWQVASRSGDLEVLRAALPSMRAWVDWVAGCLVDDIWATDKQLGDWLDPDAPPGQAWNAKADRKLVANAVYVKSIRLLVQALEVLGEPTDGYRELCERVAGAAWECWGDEARTTQAGAALFLRSGIVPAPQRPVYGAALAGLVEANGGRIGTGFLGTPEVLYALSDTGQLDAAYRLLMCDECPSWLYQVAQGATTMWERWDGIRPDGSLNTGQGSENDPGMLSFNHYAYGAVASWLHEVVAGLTVRELPEPTITVAPRPGGGLTWAEASLLTPRGTASVRWDEKSVTTVIPAGYTAWLDLGDTPVPLAVGRTVTRR
jgi:alpha-L-rhamnosidase